MKTRVLAVIVCMMAVMNVALADIIRGIKIDFVTIGNAGNSADTTGFGAVGYNYRIGKYEVSNYEWNAFVTAVSASTGNDGYWNLGDAYRYSAYFTEPGQPTNNVSWYEALQFCNYLTSGDKSRGVYQFSGNNTNPGYFLGIDRAAAQAVYGMIYFLPTEDEWYKAAYYKPDGSGYSLYANGTNTPPIAGVNSNYNYCIRSPWYVYEGSKEQNNTFNMMGNVWEWNETPFSNSSPLRGGSFYYPQDFLASFFAFGSFSDCENDDFGFRVASIPEPATLLLLGLGGLMLRKRGANTVGKSSCATSIYGGNVFPE